MTLIIIQKEEPVSHKSIYDILEKIKRFVFSSVFSLCANSNNINLEQNRLDLNGSTISNTLSIKH